MAAKLKKISKEDTLWGVILSYPDLDNPKPYKGKTYYKTDVLMEPDSLALTTLKKLRHEVCVKAWGKDKTEWPKKIQKILNGDAREDSKGYKGRFYASVATQSRPAVVDLKRKPFSPGSVKGGMFANVGVNVSTWENEGDVGLSIYLQAIQIDTSKPGLNFGGGRSIDKMFARDGEDDVDSTDDDDLVVEEDADDADIDDSDDAEPESEDGNFDD